jgi:hypothetical protein
MLQVEQGYYSDQKKTSSILLNCQKQTHFKTYQPALEQPLEPSKILELIEQNTFRLAFSRNVLLNTTKIPQDTPECLAELQQNSQNVYRSSIRPLISFYSSSHLSDALI